jgi:hypothetical protein
MQGSPEPTVIDHSIIRSKDPVQLFDKKAVTNTTEQVSDPVVCEAFRKFAIFLGINSTSTPTTLQVKIQFLDRWTGQWHTYKQGPFASFFWEDADTADGIYEMFSGDVAGRAMRVTLTGIGTSGSAYFTVDVAVEFWN